MKHVIAVLESLGFARVDVPALAGKHPVFRHAATDCIVSVPPHDRASGIFMLSIRQMVDAFGICDAERFDLLVKNAEHDAWGDALVEVERAVRVNEHGVALQRLLRLLADSPGHCVTTEERTAFERISAAFERISGAMAASDQSFRPTLVRVVSEPKDGLFMVNVPQRDAEERLWVPLTLVPEVLWPEVKQGASFVAHVNLDAHHTKLMFRNWELARNTLLFDN